MLLISRLSGCASSKTKATKTLGQLCDDVCLALHHQGYVSIGPRGDNLLITDVYVGDNGKFYVGIRSSFFDLPVTEQKKQALDICKIWTTVYSPDKSRKASVELNNDSHRCVIHVSGNSAKYKHYGNIEDYYRHTVIQ